MTFDEMRSVAEELGAKTLAREIDEIAERLAGGRFYVACLGQLKRGKSSLINALLGAAILPIGVVPVTSAVTVLRWGGERGARVVFADSESKAITMGDVGRFVSEEHNPENRLGVALVEIFVPHALLEKGLCLVDTPGVASIFAGNTEVTKRFVPHVDAALFVLGADPPIGHEELALAREIAAQTSEIVFVLNKCDRLRAEDVAEARVFTERALTKALDGGARPVLEVSAVEPGARDWAKLMSALRRLADEAGASVVARSGARNAERVRRRLLASIDDRSRALKRPIEETAREAAALETAASEIERHVRQVRAVFGAEQAHLRGELETIRGREAALSRHEIEAALSTWIAQANVGAGDLRRAAGAEARALVEARTTALRDRLEFVTAEVYGEIARRFVEELERTSRSIDVDRDRIRTALEDLSSEAALTDKTRHAFHDLMHVAPGRATAVVDRLRGAAGARRAALREALAYADRLLETNTQRAVNAQIDRVLESRRGFEAKLTARMQEIAASARAALDNAMRARERGAEAVREETERIERLRARIPNAAD